MFVETGQTRREPPLVSTPECDPNCAPVADLSDLNGSARPAPFARAARHSRPTRSRGDQPPCHRTPLPPGCTGASLSIMPPGRTLHLQPSPPLVDSSGVTDRHTINAIISAGRDILAVQPTRGLRAARATDFEGFRGNRVSGGTQSGPGDFGGIQGISGEIRGDSGDSGESSVRDSGGNSEAVTRPLIVFQGALNGSSPATAPAERPCWTLIRLP